MPESDEYRCWLSQNEQEELIDHLSEKPQRQLAVRGMLHGLRSDELQWVRTDSIRRLDTEPEAYKLRVRGGKTGYREAPVSTKMKEQMVMLKNARGIRKDDELIQATGRTVRRWVSRAGEELAEKLEDDDWCHVSPHDLRRTWATTTYYALDSHYAVDCIMRWGGWSDRDTFVNNYLGRETDELAVEMMDEANLR
ncbi:site-specific integrase [Halomicrobium urmianum]|uniref:site-specific integrase n=2 Tax=Halomicrobium urmianum TaxID=1586233 RepID=UPI001CD97705|nr:site-specific integrase [Halomicrobium urmianum]